MGGRARGKPKSTDRSVCATWTGGNELECGSGEEDWGSGVKKILKRNMRVLFNLWPPLLGAGIRVTRLDADWRAVDVEMKLRVWNRNYVGTHYGGSLYSMTDPFYMVMLIENLGRNYIVWDKSASIRFRKPGRGTVRAEFRLREEQIEEIREALRSEEKIEREFGVEVKDGEGVVIAEVRKVVHFRRKRGEEEKSSPQR
jgi:hypothetical protein